MLRVLSGVIAGSLLYTILNWVPIIGPLCSGFVAGWVARCGARRGFTVGILSAAIGFLAILYLAYSVNLRIVSIWDILLLWIFLVWNLAGFLFSGIGSTLGSALSEPIDLLSKLQRHGKTGAGGKGRDAMVYVICPNCGFGNNEKNEYCSSCGKRFVG
jgi:hypothetical protein